LVARKNTPEGFPEENAPAWNESKCPAQGSKRYWKSMRGEGQEVRGREKTEEKEHDHRVTLTRKEGALDKKN